MRYFKVKVYSSRTSIPMYSFIVVGEGESDIENALDSFREDPDHEGEYYMVQDAGVSLK